MWEREQVTDALPEVMNRCGDHECSPYYSNPVHQFVFNTVLFRAESESHPFVWTRVLLGGDWSASDLIPDSQNVYILHGFSPAGIQTTKLFLPGFFWHWDYAE